MVTLRLFNYFHRLVCRFGGASRSDLCRLEGELCFGALLQRSTADDVIGGISVRVIIPSPFPLPCGLNDSEYCMIIVRLLNPRATQEGIVLQTAPCVPTRP